MKEKIEEKDALIKNLVEKLSDFEDIFSNLKGKVIENENDQSQNKKFFSDKITENKTNLQKQVTELNQLLKESQDKIDRELLVLKNNQMEKADEMSNCSEIRNTIKLNNIQST